MHPFINAGVVSLARKEEVAITADEHNSSGGYDGQCMKKTHTAIPWYYCAGFFATFICCLVSKKTTRQYYM